MGLFQAFNISASGMTAVVSKTTHFIVLKFF